MTRNNDDVTSTGDLDSAANRRSPGRPPFETARIIDAALQIIDEEGAEALSMRSVAAHLNSSTSTLYRHFPHRAALIRAVIDRVLGEVDVDPANFRSLGWRQGCEKIARGTFEAFRRHRRAALLLADHIPVGLNSAGVRERTLAVLLDAGLDVPVAARAGAMIGHLVLGFAVQLGGDRDVTDSDREILRQSVRALDLTLFPATAAVKRARWRPTTVEEEFAFALEMVLDGLSALRGRSED